MKIFVSHSNKTDYVEELYIPIRSSDLDGRHEFFLPHESEQSINTKEEIQSSDLLLAEVSFPATGSGIEIGWADAAHIPLVFIYKEGAKVSNSVRHLTDQIIEYSSTTDLITKLSNYLDSNKS